MESVLVKAISRMTVHSESQSPRKFNPARLEYDVECVCDRSGGKVSKDQEFHTKTPWIRYKPKRNVYTLGRLTAFSASICKAHYHRYVI